MTRFYERVFVATNFIVITVGSGRTQKGATLYLFTSSLETGMLTILQTNCLKNTIIRTLLLFILNGVVSVFFCSDFTLGRHREVLSPFHATGGLAVCLPIAIEAFPIYLKIWYDLDRDEITCHTWRGNSSIRFIHCISSWEKCTTFHILFVFRHVTHEQILLQWCRCQCCRIHFSLNYLTTMNVSHSCKQTVIWIYTNILKT